MGSSENFTYFLNLEQVYSKFYSMNLKKNLIPMIYYSLHVNIIEITYQSNTQINLFS